MPRNLCRESRDVPWFPEYDVWSAVVDGVVRSMDVDDNLQFSPYKARALPYQRQHLVFSGPPAQPPGPPAPQPALPSDANLLALGKDIAALEAENAALKRENAAIKRVFNVQRLCVKQLADLATMQPAPGN